MTWSPDERAKWERFQSAYGRLGGNCMDRDWNVWCAAWKHATDARPEMTFTPGRHEVVRDTESCDLLMHPTASDLFYYRRHEGRWFRGTVPNHFTERWNGEGWALTRRVHIYDPLAHGFYFAEVEGAGEGYAYGGAHGHL